MNHFVRPFLAGMIIAFCVAPNPALGESENCPCDLIWQAALDATPCTSEMNLFNGMLRRDEVASQGTILWWGMPYPEPTSPLICLKARTFRSACDLILGAPEETRCVETDVIDRFFFSKNKFFGKCKESMRHLLLELDSLPNCD